MDGFEQLRLAGRVLAHRFRDLHPYDVDQRGSYGGFFWTYIRSLPLTPAPVSTPR
jgi:hypothetical protein